MYTNIKKIIAFGMLIALTGAQCWGAAHDDRLIKAVREKNVQNVQWLLNQQIVDVDETDQFGTTALLTALAMITPIAANNQEIMEIIQILLGAQANVNKADTYGFTPLMQAAKNDDAPMVRRLLQAGATTDRADQRDRTALDYANQNNDGLATQELENR